MKHGAGEHDTETMARLYLEQGKTAEAGAIYRRLLDRAGDDSGQILHLQELIADSETQRREARRRVTDAAGALSPRVGADLCAVVLQGPGRAACTWEVTPRGRLGAACQLAHAPGQLVLRVLVVRAAAAHAGPSRWERDLPLDAEEGEREIELVAEGGLVTAAVGLRAADGTFAAIAHAPPALAPAHRPVGAGAPAIMEVAPAEGGPEPEPAVGRMIAP